MRRPPQRLGAVPRGEGVGGETGVHEGKVGFIVGIHEIIVVLVDLDGGELALVDNVLVGEGAQVEPVLQADGVGCALAQHVQLPLEVPLVEGRRVGDLGGDAVAVGGAQDDKGLQDDGLARGGGGAQQRGILGGRAPAQHAQAERVGDVLQLPLGLVQGLLVGLEEEVADGVLAGRRQLDVLLALEVLDEELVGDGGHDAGAVAVAGVRADGAPMGHVAEEVPRWGGDVRMIVCPLRGWGEAYHR